MKNFFLVFALGITWLHSEEGVELPPELRTLQKNYEAAVARATKPITHTYLQELERLKLKYGRNGLPQNALAVESVMSELQERPDDGGEVDPSAIPLRKMSLEQFKNWLTTVEIVELEGPFGIRYLFDGKNVTTTKRGQERDARQHENVDINVGTIFVPFTSTNATIQISLLKESAEVTYSSNRETYQAKVEQKK